MKITVFSGGRGTEAIVKAIFFLREEEVVTDLELTLLVNAYDNGRSTSGIRALFDLPGPSDPLKNLILLLDPEAPSHSLFAAFLDTRFGKDDDNDSGGERTLLEAMSREDRAVLENYRKGAVFLQLPEPFRKLVAEGLRLFLERMDALGVTAEYTDFSLMNAALAGLAGVGGNLQEALDRVQNSGELPLRGRVVLNTLENRYLYAVPEVTKSGVPRLLDEAGIVAHRSHLRIKDLYLLPRPLREDEVAATGAAVEAGLASAGTGGLASANPRALECLQSADAIIYGPGTQHSSLLPTYLTDGFANVISENKDARKILICNTGEDVDTHGYSASDIYLSALRYMRKGTVKGSIAPWKLINDVIVNFPGSGTAGIQPNSAFFETLPDSALWYADSPDAVPPDTLQRITLADVESENNASRHSSTKLRDLFARILTGKPLWYQKVRGRLTFGAIIFDVDETILEPATDRLAGSHRETEIEPPVIAILIELLDAGFNLCAVTGNDFKKFRGRFVRYLEERLREMKRLDLIEGFEAYGDGAATHVTFAVEDGALVPRQDSDYNAANQMQADDYRILRGILSEFAERTDLIPPPDELFQTYDRGSWKYQYSADEGRWLEDEKPLLRVEDRGDRVMLTLKSLPSRHHLRKGLVVNETVRRRVWREILDRMARGMQREQAANYSCTIAGRGSIDITRRISKATAVRHYLHRHKLRECDVIYFGNELSVGGNDRPVATGIPGVHVISVNQLESEVQFEKNIFYGGGRGTASARQQFGDILERLRRALSLAEKYSPAPAGLVPVIHEKIEALYKEKLEQHRDLIAREPGFNEADRFHMLSRQLSDVNQALRLRSGREISLIIPAAGDGGRLGNGVPKPLFPVAGKPAFLGPLEAFAPLAGRIAMIVSPEHREQFTRILEGRPERIHFVEQPRADGDWDAVRRGFEALSPCGGPVIVAWADLAFATVSRIRETVDFHQASGADMTFPTFFERDPYARLVRNDFERPVALVLTAYTDTPKEGYFEHDCSFFVLQPEALALVLKELTARAAVRTPGDPEVRFIDAVAILHQKGRRVEALPICRPGEFMGFTKLEEANRISRLINSHD